MKKILIFVGLILIAVSSFSQEEDEIIFRDSIMQYVNDVKTTLIVPESDTLAKYKNAADPVTDFDLVNFRTLLEYVYVDIVRIVEVSPGGEREYTTITDAMNSITDAAADNTYAIAVYPGTYDEQIIGKDYVTIIGTDDALVQIVGNTPPLWTPAAKRSSILNCTIACDATSSGHIVSSTAATGDATADNRIQYCTLSWSTSTPGVVGGILDINSDGLLLLQSCIFIYTNSNTGVLATSNAFNLSGSMRVLFDTFVFTSNLAQSGGDVNIFNDSSTGVVTISNADGDITMTNASWTDNLIIWKVNNSNTNTKYSISTISRILGAGDGAVYGVFSNTAGTSRVDLNTTIFEFNDFADEYFAWAGSPGDVVNGNFANGSADNPTGAGTGGSGTVNKVVIQNGTFLVNTDIVDENMFIGNSTNKGLNDLFNIVSSAGYASGGEITDNEDGTVDVAAGTGLIRTSNDEQAPIKMFDWPESTGIILADETDNYIGIDYNSGDPIILVSTNEDIFLDNENNIFELYAVYREQADVHISIHYQRSKNIGSQLQRLAYAIDHIRWTDGIIVSGTGTRNVQTTAGTYWIKSNEIDILALNTAVTDTFTRYYTSDSGVSWTKTTGLTQWDNLQYNDPTTGLVPVGNSKWSFQDWYMDADNDLVSIYGQDEYNNEGDATSAPSISTLPGRLEKHSKRIGRVVFVLNAATGSFITFFEGNGNGGTPVSDHALLAGLLGDGPNYYHPNSDQYSILQNFGDSVAIHAGWQRNGGVLSPKTITDSVSLGETNTSVPFNMAFDNPAIRTKETDQIADAKIWEIGSSASNYEIKPLQDNGTPILTALQLKRDGDVVVFGNVQAATSKFTTGAANGSFLKSDATGLGSWSTVDTLNTNIDYSNWVNFVGNHSGSGSANHSELFELDYASAGHTDFAGTGVINTFTQSQEITGNGLGLTIRSNGASNPTISLINQDVQIASLYLNTLEELYLSSPVSATIQEMASGHYLEVETNGIFGNPDNASGTHAVEWNSVTEEFVYDELGGNVSGAGVNGRLALWSGANTLIYDDDFSYTASTLTATSLATSQLAAVDGSLKLTLASGVNGSVTFNDQFINAVKVSAPTPVEGMQYYNSTDNKLYLRNNTEWIDLGQSGSVSLWTDGGTEIYPTNGEDILLATTSPPELIMWDENYSNTYKYSLGANAGGSFSINYNNATSKGIELFETGKVRFPDYGSGGNIGTVTFPLATNSNGDIIETLAQPVSNGAKTASFIHDAKDASIGAYTLSTAGAVTISIHNLSSGMMGTIILDIATNPSAITVDTYSDAGSTGLTEVTIGNAIANEANKSTTITYICANNSSVTEVKLMYGQE